MLRRALGRAGWAFCVGVMWLTALPGAALLYVGMLADAAAERALAWGRRR